MAKNPADSKGKILLVDDDPGLLRLLSIRLRAEHYDVEAVESAEKALAVLNRFRPELVVIEGGRGRVFAYFREHGYELIERYVPFDTVNRYFRPAAATEAAARSPGRD